MTSVYHPNTIIPQLAVQPNGKWPKSGKNTLENKNVSLLNKLILPWTTSDCSTSTTHFIAHPMAYIAGMISIFHLHNTLNYPNTNVKKYK